MILIRKLSRTEHPTTIVFYFTVFATLAGAVSLPFGQWVTPATLLDLGLLVAIGLIGGFAQFAMTHAFRLAPVAIVAPFDYLALVFAMMLGYAIWDRSEEHTSELQSLMRISYAVFCLNKKTLK